MTQMKPVRSASGDSSSGETRPLGIRRSCRSPIELQSGDPRSTGDERSNEETTSHLRPPSLSDRGETIVYIGGSPLKRSPRRSAECALIRSRAVLTMRRDGFAKRIAEHSEEHKRANAAGVLVTLEALQHRAADEDRRRVNGLKRVRSSGHIRTASQPPLSSTTTERGRSSAVDPDEPFEIEL